VYRILKARGLITSQSHILLSAGNEFNNKTCFVNEMWQTDFTYFKILGWGWYYLSTILDDKKIQLLHGRPNHPQTQGKIERYHRSMKNVVKLDNYYCPEELEASLSSFPVFITSVSNSLKAFVVLE
jgi:transposase InsO family protein